MGHYAKKHPFRFALFTGLGILGIGAFIAGTVLTGGALLAGGAAAAGLAGLVLSGTGAVGGTLMLSGGAVAVASIVGLRIDKRSMELSEQEKKLAGRLSHQSETDIQHALGGSAATQRRPSETKKLISEERPVTPLEKKPAEKNVKSIDWKKELKNIFSREDVSKYMAARDKLKLQSARPDTPVDHFKSIMNHYRPSVTEFIKNEKERLERIETDHPDAVRGNNDFKTYKTYVFSVASLLDTDKQETESDAPHPKV